MSHPRPAAPLGAVLLGLVLTGAVCAQARTALAFEEVPRFEPPRRPHRAAYACALGGVALMAASFPLADAADRRYGEYLREGDPRLIESRWDRSVWADRKASAALLGGEALLAAGVYLRFVHGARESRIALAVGPGRCAVACSF